MIVANLVEEEGYEGEEGDEEKEGEEKKEGLGRESHGEREKLRA